MTFSIITEPCIPVETLDGDKQMVSVRELFLNAHLYKGDLAARSPHREYSLIRVLVGFAVACYKLRLNLDRLQLIDSGKFEIATFDKYIAECEKEGPRFDLCDPVHPLFQVTESRIKTDRKTRKSSETSKKTLQMAIDATEFVCLLDIEFPQTASLRLQNAYPREAIAYTPAEAFGFLCEAMHANIVHGKGYSTGYCGVNNSIIIKGKTLFETVVFNMLTQSDSIKRIGYGTEAWVRDDFLNVTGTYLEMYTWPTRSINLIWDSDGLTRRMYFDPGVKSVDVNEGIFDPTCPYKIEAGKRKKMPPQITRELWRDVNALIVDPESPSAKLEQPIVLRNFKALTDGLNCREVIIELYGLVADQASIHAFFYHPLSLPVFMLTNKTAEFILKQDIEGVEDIQKGIATSVSNKLGKKKQNLAARYIHSFLSKAHDIIFSNVNFDKIRALADQPYSADSYIDYKKWFYGQIMEAAKSVSHTELDPLITSTDMLISISELETDIRKKILARLKKKER